MLEWIVNQARWFRRQFYQLSSTRIYGFELDVALHFLVGAIIFASVARYWGNRSACWSLAAAIFLKEIIDVFAKSNVDYVQVPGAAGWRDIVEDVFFSALGGLAVWLLQRWRQSRSRK
jgi:outer membrane receptor protein involved in Fe transport